MPTLKPLWLDLAAIAERAQRAEAVFLACDYDGTLTPLAARPDAVRLPDRTRRVLHRLGALPGVHVAVFSGRPLEDLERQLGPGPLFLVASCGLETRDEEGRRRTHAHAARPAPAPLREALETWCARFPGAWIEERHLSYALHYRTVAAALQPAFCAGVRRRVRPHRGQVLVVHGRRVFEILPEAQGGKSAALQLWLEGRRARGPVFYFGDDTNDEPVYGPVRERGGIAVAVARTVSRAEYALPSPVEVTWFLEWLEREWTARAPAPAVAAADEAARA